jgi:hypothetical protein
MSPFAFRCEADGEVDRGAGSRPINVVRWEGDALSAMNLERDGARFIRGIAHL